MEEQRALSRQQNVPLSRRPAVVRETIPAVVVCRRARISGFAQPAMQVVAQALLRGAVRSLPRDVLQLIGIAPQVVELLGRTFGRGQLEELQDRWLRPAIEQQRLRWAAVDVAERPDGDMLL